MSRWIDADVLENKAKQYSLGYYEEDEWAVPFKEITSAPSIDIVRCKECKYWDDTIPNEIYCSLLEGLCDISGDSFCSYGEREGE